MGRKTVRDSAAGAVAAGALESRPVIAAGALSAAGGNDRTDGRPDGQSALPALPALPADNRPTSGCARPGADEYPARPQQATGYR